MENKNNQDSSNLANRYYSSEDYKKKDQVSQGLATTHEQVSDTFTEGEIKAVIDDVNGEDIPVERKGYEE
jgi:hypothetical protein